MFRKPKPAQTLDDTARLVEQLREVESRLTGWTTAGSECPSPKRLLGEAAREIERLAEGKYDAEIAALAAVDLELAPASGGPRA